MSARAAWRIETLGFTRVYRYRPGKADWLANGLPVEGTQANVPRAGQVARPDIPTCQLGERVGDVRPRVTAAGWDMCLVVTDDNVVLGRLRGKALQANPTAIVDEVMEEGPTTIRPDTLLVDIVPRMQERHVVSIIVTTPGGRLIGVMFRPAAEARLAAFQATPKDTNDS
ncbi:MAG TPA: CBS domain-containing protein [Chloroflexota bacterium]|nr:CBS domain-containing protein [Chloroflexota bacterium]